MRHAATRMCTAHIYIHKETRATSLSVCLSNTCICTHTHTHRPTDGLVEAVIDWAAGQREDTATEKYMPKQFPRQLALNSQSAVLTY